MSKDVLTWRLLGDTVYVYGWRQIKAFFYVYIFFEILKPNRFQLLFKYTVLLLQ